MIAYSETNTLLDIQNVSKEYSGKLILKNVNVTIKDIIAGNGECKGQIVGFLGPSGAGKSTLFRIMAGLESPSSGRVVLDGTDRAVRSGEVGVVAQNYPLFAHRTVYSNLMLAARQRYNAAEAKERVVAYLNDFDLADRVNAYPAQLSGGQRQRCAILQQVLNSETFLLMDEPFSGLDPIAKKKTQQLITRVANLSEANTVVIVSHDITATAAISDHLWLLGRERDTENRIIPGASIVEVYDLLKLDLAWDPEIENKPEFTKFIREVNARFSTL